MIIIIIEITGKPCHDFVMIFLVNKVDVRLKNSNRIRANQAKGQSGYKLG